MGKPIRMNFKKGHIVKRFRWEEFQKIAEKNLVDFLPHIRGDSPIDGRTLETWENHLRGKFNGRQLKFKIPYVITKNPKTGARALWKEGAY